MKRLVFVLAVASVTAMGQTTPQYATKQYVDTTKTDNTVYVRNSPGATVGEKVAAAQTQCNPDASIPCILVIDPSLAAGTPGVLPSLAANQYLVDWRGGTPWPNAINCGSTTYTTYQACLNAASASAGTVVFPSGAYTLTDELNVPAGVSVFAYGATLTWTAMGQTLCSTPATCAATGNGIRLNSNSSWHGGTLVMSSVASPSGVSIPGASFSGAFWNAFAVGDFNTVTTASMASGVHDVLIEDVATVLSAGSRYHAIFVGGYASNVKVSNWTDQYDSTSTAASSAYEASWGNDATYSYHPYGLTVENAVLNEYAGTANDADAEGVRFSGAYNVDARNITVNNSNLPMVFYIGDAGDPGTGAGCIAYPSQRGRIGSGLNLENYAANGYNIGLEILGDANGSVCAERGTHRVYLKASQINLNGPGTAVSYGGWTSNIGVLNNQASGWRIEGGQVRNDYDGVYFNGLGAGSTYDPYTGIEVGSLTIHNIGRSGIRATSTVGAIFHDNNIYSVGLDAGATGSYRAAIYTTGQGNRILNNTFGATADSGAANYGVVSADDGTGKLTPSIGGLNVLTGNHTLYAQVSAYDGDAAVFTADDVSNTVLSGILFSSGSTVPSYNGASFKVANTIVIPSSATGYTGAGKVVLSTGVGFSGSCASTTTTVVVNGIITGCS
jgi:hypothetical protein